MNPPITNPNEPRLRGVLETQKSEILYGLNCHEVGHVVSFDSNTQTATVQIDVLRQIVDAGQIKNVPYPLLTDCPVHFPGGGDFSLQFPVTAGDTCLVLFNDRDIDLWFKTGNNVSPNTSRAHDLSDGLVLVGFRNLQKVLKNWTGECGIKKGSTASIVIDDDGNVSMRTMNNVTITLYSTGSFSITGLLGLAITGTNAGLVNIFNNNISLGGALDQLFSSLTSWVDTHGDTPNPATIAAINAAKTSLHTILQ